MRVESLHTSSPHTTISETTHTSSRSQSQSDAAHTSSWSQTGDVSPARIAHAEGDPARVSLPFPRHRRQQLLGWLGRAGQRKLAASTVLIVLTTSHEPITRETKARFGFGDYLVLLRRPNVIRLLLADLFVTLGPGWMAALYLFYFKDSRGFDTASANILLMVYIAAGFAGAPFTAWLGNRMGKHRALMVSTTVYSIGLIIVPFLPSPMVR